jgi:HD-like signal output (HDOD) protein
MNPALVDRAIEKIAHEAGVLLAKKWRFSEEILRSIEHSQDWSYQTGGRPDLTNIVLTAKYHYALSRSGLKSIPRPRDVPSIAAATCGQFDENVSLKILCRAKELMSGTPMYCTA